MIHTVAHRRNKRSRFAMNHYQCCGIVFVRDKQEEPIIIIQYKEGNPQGYSLLMITYGIYMMLLAKKMQREVPESLQPCFVDNVGLQEEQRTMFNTLISW